MVRGLTAAYQLEIAPSNHHPKIALGMPCFMGLKTSFDKPQAQQNLTAQRHHFLVGPPLRQRHDLGGNGLHHALDLVGVAVAIVDRRDIALDVILDSEPSLGLTVG
jgi:hypothetical protein